eukprot:5364986-Alexandrium_andersonii.AAC.1
MPRHAMAQTKNECSDKSAGSMSTFVGSMDCAAFHQAPALAPRVIEPLGSARKPPDDQHIPKYVAPPRSVV